MEQGTSIADIMRRKDEAEKFTKPFHRAILKRRRLYDGKHYDTPPQPDEPQYVDPTLTNTVDLAVGILHSEDVIWHATGFNKTPAEGKGSDLVEKAIAGFIDVNKDRTQIDLFHTTNVNFTRDGGSVLYGVWDKDTHDNCRKTDLLMHDDGSQEEVEVLYELPLDIRAIDPLKIYLLPGGKKRWLSIMRVEEMTVYDVEKKFGIVLEKYKNLSDETKLTTKGELIDYWDYAYVDEVQEGYEALLLEDVQEGEIPEPPPTVRKLKVRNAVLFEQEWILPLRVMDGYNDLPYTINFYNPTDPDDSSKWNSILTPLETPVKELEIAINRRQRGINMYASLPMIVRTEDGRPVAMDAGMGKVIPLKMGEDAGFPVWQGNPPDVDKQIELYRSRIQQSGFSDVMFGEGPSGVSGYALSQMGDQNRIRLETAIRHLEDLWTWAARKWLSLAQEFAPETYLELYGNIRGTDFVERIKGADLQGFQVRCEIKAEFPNERVRNHAMSTQVANILSPQTIMERYLGIQQPGDEHQKKLNALAEQDPTLMKYAVMKKMEQLAQAGDIAASIVIEQLKQQLTKGQGNRQMPQQAVSPEQLTGTQSATGAPPSDTSSPEAAVNQALDAMAGGAAPQMSGAVGNAEIA